jgi:enoyl-CoA hydratase/carnithine racemase
MANDRTDSVAPGEARAQQEGANPLAAYQKIQYEVRDGVAHVVLNRPERLNALDFGPGSMREEILSALARSDGDPAVGTILISGAGRAFCAGGDLGKVVASQGGAEPTIDGEHAFMDMVAHFDAGVRATRKPVIAAVHGMCLGIGMSFIVQCDFVLAAEGTRFGLIEGRIGHPGALELVAAVGPTWAKFLILTGEMIDARRAKDIGLVMFVLAPEVLMARANDLAARMARMPRSSALMNKACINESADAAGRTAGRQVGRPYEAMTKLMSWQAAAPDGRLFTDILRDEGMQEMKRAREQQYKESWLQAGD